MFESHHKKASFKIQWNKIPAKFTIFCSLIIMLIIIILLSTPSNSFLSIIFYSGMIKLCSIYYGYYDFRCYPFHEMKVNVIDNHKIYRIVLFGDSLIGVANRKYGLALNIQKKLHNSHPSVNFELIVSAKNGNKIQDLRNRLFTDCIAYKPDSVIIYWDSDVDNPNNLEYINSNHTKLLYTSNLQYVLTQLKQYNISHIAVAGPGLLGELPQGQNKADTYADEYAAINKRVAQTMNVDYIDIRQAFFNYNKLQPNPIYYGEGNKGVVGNLTVDGEHPSAIGSGIEEKLFYEQLVDWYMFLCERYFGYGDFHCYTSSKKIKTIDSDNHKIFRIVLFGDSLIVFTNRQYGLASNIMKKLHNSHPSVKFELIVSGKEGNKIQDLRNRLYTDCIAYKPDSVIIYWDSDIGFNFINSNHTKLLYTSNLEYVVKQLKQYNITHIAVAGPGLLGELPQGQNKADTYADEYAEINKRVAKAMHVDYIDIRQAFFNYNKLQQNPIYYGEEIRGIVGNLTIDGEHPSVIGSEIEEKVFYNQLLTWYDDDINKQ